MVYPCKECTAVEDTKGCNRIYCGDWKHWFLNEWKKFHDFYENYMKDQVAEDG